MGTKLLFGQGPRRVASGELPVLTPEVQERLTGSLSGADEATIQAQAVAVNPSRRLLQQQCTACQYEWQAPAAGACPKCHSAETIAHASVVCMARRV